MAPSTTLAKQGMEKEKAGSSACSSKAASKSQLTMRQLGSAELTNFSRKSTISCILFWSDLVLSSLKAERAGLEVTKNINRREWEEEDIGVMERVGTGVKPLVVLLGNQICKTLLIPSLHKGCRWCQKPPHVAQGSKIYCEMNSKLLLCAWPRV